MLAHRSSWSVGNTTVPGEMDEECLLGGQPHLLQVTEWPRLEGNSRTMNLQPPPPSHVLGDDVAKALCHRTAASATKAAKFHPWNSNNSLMSDYP